MPIEGYIRKRPDTGWWLEQIRAAEQFRKQTAFEDKWPTWRDYYRGKWNRDVMPVNLFFTMVRTIVPRIYFRDPSVSVAPGKPGLLNLTFARMLERIDNKLLRQMKFKKQVKRSVQRSFMFGTGILKVGFGGLYTPTPIGDDDDLPLGKMGERVEYADFTAPNMPWVANIQPKNFLVPNGLIDWEYSRWCAEYIVRTIEDVRADPRLDNVKNLRPSKTVQTPFGTLHRPEDLVEMYEIRDRKTGSVMVISPNKGDDEKTLFFGPDVSQLYGGFPYFPIIFNEDDEHFWGLPDSQILEPYQLEINEIKTQIMKHRRSTLVKILVEKGKMEPVEAERLTDEDVSAVAWVKGNPNEVVKLMAASAIPPELFIAAEAVIQDTRETVGFSRNQFGEFNSRSGDTSATEAQIVKMASEIRIDERRDELADNIVDIIKYIHGIIFDNWGEEQIVDVIGPGGLQVWVRFRGDLLRTGRYNVRVDPDSSVPETRSLREARALQLYQVLQTNPLIDPFKLTQYLLHELKGVQFDDMMKMLPPAEGGQPNGVVGPQDLAQMIGNSLGQVARPGGAGLLAPPAASNAVGG